MDLKKHIEDNYGTQYRFCEEKNIKQSKVNYWCNKEWKMMNYTTRQKICDILGVEMVD